MAEFVNKGALMKAYKKLPIQKTAEVDCGDGFRNRPLVDLALVYEMICSQPTTTEAELCASVIEEFYDEVLNFEDYIEPIEERNGVLLYSGRDITNMIVDIKRKLKGEKE